MKPDICQPIREALLLTQTSTRAPHQPPALTKHLFQLSLRRMSAGHWLVPSTSSRP